ncbi:EVE domain-containing protein [Asaia sp. VD9]|uniref:EVE domain-containing protein n=1 Tax=Asaia sp. VD9 TaxID=3081235 RepID=UPI0030196E37
MRHWIAVASAEHVERGKSLGIMQVCHGKAAPLRQISPGDRVIYYSPVSRFGGKDRLQAFTAIGTVVDTMPYQVEMSEGFRPWRRDVQWQAARETSIRPLLGRLSFAGNGANWGYRFRFGLFEIDDEDAALIATEMIANFPGQAQLARHEFHADRPDLPLFACLTYEGSSG